MELLSQSVCNLPVTDDDRAWPVQAKAMMSMLEDAFEPLDERRKLTRHRYRVQAHAQFPNPRLGAFYERLYVRDINTTSAGFIAPAELAAGQEGTLDLPSPDGLTMRVDFVVVRCSQFATGWYEGAIQFVERQRAFSRHRIN